MSNLRFGETTAAPRGHYAGEKLTQTVRVEKLLLGKFRKETAGALCMGTGGWGAQPSQMRTRR